MTYHFAYGEDTPYSRALALVERHRTHADGVVVDLGCGYGAIAEPIESLELSYLGVDLEPSGVKDLSERGMETMVADLGTPDALFSDLERVLEDRPVAAICMLDVLEHLPNPSVVLERVQQFAQKVGGPPLVVSIPNVTHVDLGVKLLMGRWDVTPTGLLDATHLRFFSETHLESTMRRAGWAEVGASDFELTFSDQHFPAGSVALERGTPLGAFLTELRERASGTAFVNQFVRAYLPTLAPAGVESGPVDAGNARADLHAPFLSVLMRTRATRESTLVEALLSLAAQSCDDFEVLLLVHDPAPGAMAVVEQTVAEFHEAFARRVHVVPVRGGSRSRPLNEGARLARGRYLAVLDDDDLAFAHWVQTLESLANRAPGRVLRLGVAHQNIVDRPGAWAGADGYDLLSKPFREYPLDFDHVGHFAGNRTPSCGYAVPRSFVVDLGHHWDEDLSVLEDWELLLRSASLCGVECEPTVGALARVWKEGERSTTVHNEQEWEAARASVIASLDASPVLLGRNSVSRLVQLLEADQHSRAEVSRLRQELESVHEALSGTQQELTDVRASTSWRITVVARFVTAQARKVMQRHKRSPR